MARSPYKLRCNRERNSFDRQGVRGGGQAFNAGVRVEAFFKGCVYFSIKSRQVPIPTKLAWVVSAKTKLTRGAQEWRRQTKSKTSETYEVKQLRRGISS